MALQISKTTEQGVVSSECYVKIARFFGDKDKVVVDYDFFYNAQARLDGKRPLESASVELATPTTDILVAIYTHIKTLPGFENALDV